MSQESWQPCWRHCRDSLDNPMSTPWPYWSLTVSSTCLRFVCPRILVFFLRDIDEMNIYHVRIPTCFADAVYLTKFWWITVFTRPWATSSDLTGCPEMEPLIAEDLLWKETVQPILPWEDAYPFITVNKSDFFQGPSKQMLPLLSHCCCFEYFSYWQYKELPRSLFGCFPCPIGSG